MSDKKNDDQYTCSICLESLTKNIKGLGCNHFYCIGCYETFKAYQTKHKKDVFCPQCHHVEIAFPQPNTNDVIVVMEDGSYHVFPEHDDIQYLENTFLKIIMALVVIYGIAFLLTRNLMF